MSAPSFSPNPFVVQQLAPKGVLRAGINMSNFLLVNGKTESGDPVGVAPSMAAEVARLLGVTLQMVPFANPGLLADAAGTDTWDIGLFGADPLRSKTTAFTPAYCEIEASYLVPPDSRLKCVTDVDQPGVTIAVFARSAYGLWLERNNQHATLLPCDAGGAARRRARRVTPHRGSRRAHCVLRLRPRMSRRPAPQAAAIRRGWAARAVPVAAIATAVHRRRRRPARSAARSVPRRRASRRVPMP